MPLPHDCVVPLQIPLAASFLFDRIAHLQKERTATQLPSGADETVQPRYVVAVSLLEIYNEKVFDLLAQPARGGKGKARTDGLDVRQGDQGFFVQGLS